MAKLPTRDSLGPMPSARSGRPVASVDVSASGRALEGLGNSISNFAEVQIQKQREREAHEAEMAYLQFDWNERQNLDQTMQSMEPGQARQFAQSWQKGYLERATQFRSNVPQHVQPAIDKKLFGTETSLFGSALTFERQEQTRFAKQRIGEMSDTIWKAKAQGADNEGLTELYSEARNAIYNDPELTPIERDALWDKTQDDIALAHLESLPPDERIDRIDTLRATRGSRGALIKYESGGRYDIKNNLGYAGRMQFGAPRLADLGIYTPGPNEKVKGNSRNWTGNPAAQWTGTWNISGVNSIEDFLNSKEAQHIAEEAHEKEISAFINRNGLDKYIGQEIGGIVITEESMFNMAHLGGNGGLKDFLESGGKKNVADANGTSLADYARLGSPLGDEVLGAARDVAVREQKAKIKAEKNVLDQERDTALEELQFRIADGTAGKDDIEQFREDYPDLEYTEYEKLNTELKQAEKERLEVGRVASVLDESGSINIYDTKDRKALDKVYEQSLLGVEDKEQAARKFIEKANYVPDSLVKDIRSGLVSQDSETFLNAVSLAEHALEVNPSAFAGRAGDKGIAKAVDQITAYRERGFSDEEAVRRYRESQDPEVMRKRKAFLDDKATKKWIVDNSTPSDVLSAFDPGIFSFEPDFINDTQAATVAGEYKTELEDALVETGGDRDAAEQIAKARMSRRYGISEMNLGGDTTLMRHPPEKYYPNINGHDYVQKQLRELITNVEGVDPDTVYLQADEFTEADIEQGRIPRYQVWYRDANNRLQMLLGGHFVPDVEQAGGEAQEARTRQRELAREANERARQRELERQEIIDRNRIQ